VFNKILNKIANELEKHKIPYMVIGGQAVLLYGEPRLTKDIDITLDMGIEGYTKVREVVENLFFKILVDNPQEFLKKTMVLPTIEEKSGIRIDFIFSFTPYEKQAIGNAIDVKINDKMVKFASLEDVVIHKIIAGRARDIEDVKAILLKNPDYNSKYIYKWLNDFDKSLNEKFLDKFKRVEKEL
jgi:predicted nucleotidyltransferase